jgi:hypothetical protein
VIVKEKMCVLFGETGRGIVLQLEGQTCVVRTMGGHDCSVLISNCRPMPATMCILCGLDEGGTPKEIAGDVVQAERRVKRDWGAVPPPERRAPMCPACAKRLYDWDKKSTICTCAFSRGEAEACTCKERRERGLQP